MHCWEFLIEAEDAERHWWSRWRLVLVPWVYLCAVIWCRWWTESWYSWDSFYVDSHFLCDEWSFCYSTYYCFIFKLWTFFINHQVNSTVANEFALFYLWLREKYENRLFIFSLYSKIHMLCLAIVCSLVSGWVVIEGGLLSFVILTILIVFWLLGNYLLPPRLIKNALYWELLCLSCLLTLAASY